MRKRDELTDLNSCFNKADDSELMFVLLDRDAAAPETIRFWAAKRVKLGLNKWGDPKIVEAVRLALTMEEANRAIKKHAEGK